MPLGHLGCQEIERLQPSSALQGEFQRMASVELRIFRRGLQLILWDGFKREARSGKFQVGSVASNRFSRLSQGLSSTKTSTCP